MVFVFTENFDTKKNELTKQGFMDLHLMEANDREGDPLDLWVTLHSMGYNKALQLTEVKHSYVDNGSILMVFDPEHSPDIWLLNPGTQILDFQ